MGRAYRKIACQGAVRGLDLEHFSSCKVKGPGLILRCPGLLTLLIGRAVPTVTTTNHSSNRT
jgi:hypothetical protein